jgi:predicted NBD/HSP70 family sugar kinase
VSTRPPSVDRGANPAPGAQRVDQAKVRASNLALVARTVYAAEPAPTRAAVAAATSMTRSTVSRLVDDLVAGGIVTELQVARTGRGRPGTPLAPAPGRFVALGLQVDVHYLAAIVVDLRGDRLAQRVVTDDLHGSQPAPVLERLASLAQDLVAELTAPTVVVGAGLALPGIVTAQTGQLLHAPNLGWSDVDVSAAIDPSRLGGARIMVGNEADLASVTVSQTRPGHPSGLQDFIHLSGEAGIGGAIVLGGTPLRGRHGWGGELGHVTVDPAGPACPCGSTGCLEQYAGKPALLTAAGLAPHAPMSELAARAARGEPAAAAALDRAAWALGCALADVVNVVDVPVIVLGGHLRDVAQLVAPRVEATLRGRVLSARWVPPTLRGAPASTAPGAVGGAYLELGKVIADPARWLDGATRRT